MPHTLDDTLATAVVALYPHLVQRHRPAAPLKLCLERLLEEEHARRGIPDVKTGALLPPALTQGTLLKEEFDLATHGEGWTVGAFIADVKGLIHVNARHGFPTGDAVLKAVASTLRASFPGARLVRMQGDCLTALLVPSSGLKLEERSRETVLAKLVSETHTCLPSGAEPLDFTVAQLELTLVQPGHWQVLGPLVWAELERAYAMQRLGRTQGLQRRRLELGGFLPAAP